MGVAQMYSSIPGGDGGAAGGAGAGGAGAGTGAGLFTHLPVIIVM